MAQLYCTTILAHGGGLRGIIEVINEEATMQSGDRISVGHRIAALANLSVLPSLFLYFELTGQQSLTRVAACSAALIVATYGAVRTALEAHQAGQHHNQRNQADKQKVCG